MTTIGLSYSLVKISTKCAPALEYERVEAGKANPVKLKEKWMTLCDEEGALKAKLAEIVQRKSQVRRIATQCGVALPE